MHEVLVPSLHFFSHPKKRGKLVNPFNSYNSAVYVETDCVSIAPNLSRIFLRHLWNFSCGHSEFVFILIFSSKREPGCCLHVLRNCNAAFLSLYQRLARNKGPLWYKYMTSWMMTRAGAPHTCKSRGTWAPNYCVNHLILSELFHGTAALEKKLIWNKSWASYTGGDDLLKCNATVQASLAPWIVSRFWNRRTEPASCIVWDLW